jgi:hypothetical protein
MRSSTTTPSILGDPPIIRNYVHSRIVVAAPAHASCVSPSGRHHEDPTNGVAIRRAGQLRPQQQAAGAPPPRDRVHDNLVAKMDVVSFGQRR